MRYRKKVSGDVAKEKKIIRLRFQSLRESFK